MLRRGSGRGVDLTLPLRRPDNAALSLSRGRGTRIGVQSRSVCRVRFFLVLAPDLECTHGREALDVFLLFPYNLDGVKIGTGITHRTVPVMRVGLRSSTCTVG